MNNKGFAVTTIIYTILILLSFSMLLIMGLLSNEYVNQKDYINDINDNLTECLERNEC